MSQVATAHNTEYMKPLDELVEVGLILTYATRRSEPDDLVPTFQMVVISNVTATRRWVYDKNRWSSLRYTRHTTHPEAMTEFQTEAARLVKHATRYSGRCLITPLPLWPSDAKAVRNGWIRKWVFEHGLAVMTTAMGKPDLAEPEVTSVPEPEPEPAPETSPTTEYEPPIFTWGPLVEPEPEPAEPAPPSTLAAGLSRLFDEIFEAPGTVKSTTPGGEAF